MSSSTIRKGLISYSPRRGFLVSMRAQCPRTQVDKVAAATSIIRAVESAHNFGLAGVEAGEVAWCLKFAVGFLDQAAGQMGGLQHG